MARKLSTGLSRERLLEVLNYDPETGTFTHKIARRNAVPGAPAGGTKPNGYLTLKIDGKNYYAHRVAWLYVTGRWPLGEIDHINRNRSDNRFENLREVSSTQNVLNRVTVNAVGLRGVTKYWNKYRAFIRLNGRTNYLGSFDTAEDAHQAYVAACIGAHGYVPSLSIES